MFDHKELIKYGVATSNRSNDILKRLNVLGFVENEDYLLLDIQQQVSSGTKHIKKYMLTPEAFFLVLQRARHIFFEPKIDDGLFKSITTTLSTLARCSLTIFQSIFNI